MKNWQFRFLSSLILLGTTSKAFAADDCINGRYAVKDNTFFICRQAYAGVPFSTELIPPTNQEWKAFTTQFKDDPKYKSVIERASTLTVPKVLDLIERRTAAGQGMVLRSKSPEQEQALKDLAFFLNEKQGVDVAQEEAEAARRDEELSARIKLNQLAEDAERARLGESFTFKDMSAIVESNRDAIEAIQQRGCEEGIAFAKSGQPMRGLDIAFRDGLSGRIFPIGYSRKGDQVTLKFVHVDPLYGDFSKVLTRVITVRPGDDPSWPTSDGTHRNLVPTMKPVAAKNVVGVRDVSNPECVIAESFGTSIPPTSDPEAESTK